MGAGGGALKLDAEREALERVYASWTTARLLEESELNAHTYGPAAIKAMRSVIEQRWGEEDGSSADFEAAVLELERRREAARLEEARLEAIRREEELAKLGRSTNIYTTVGTFLNPPTAEVARGRLESEGIEAHVHDDFIVGIYWTYSYAVNGVKVRVKREEAEEAERILRESYEDLLEAPEPGDVADDCVRCGSDFVVPYDAVRFVAALTLFPFWYIWLFLCLPFANWDARWRCLGCRCKW